MLTSEDGIVWSAQNTVCANTLTAVAYGNGVFVAVGDYSTVLRMGNSQSLRLEIHRNTVPTLWLYGAMGQTYRIEQISTLTNSPDWTPAIDIMVTNNPTTWQPVYIRAPQSYFFRASKVP